MVITAIVLDQNGNPMREVEVPVDPISIMVLAETREEVMRSKGAGWAAGMISYLGKQLADIAAADSSQAEVENAAIQVAIASWLYDSIYGNLEAELFAKSNLHFIVSREGAVKYDRYLSD